MTVDDVRARTRSFRPQTLRACVHSQRMSSACHNVINWHRHAGRVINIDAGRRGPGVTWRMHQSAMTSSGAL